MGVFLHLSIRHRTIWRLIFSHNACKILYASHWSWILAMTIQDTTSTIISGVHHRLFSTSSWFTSRDKSPESYHGIIWNKYLQSFIIHQYYIFCISSEFHHWHQECGFSCHSWHHLCTIWYFFILLNGIFSNLNFSCDFIGYKFWLN